VEHRQFVPRNPEHVAGELNSTGEASVHRVMPQKMRELGGVRQVVDRHELHVEIRLVRRAKRGPTDPPETVDRHSHSHGVLLGLMSA
jgi:hypothetical protein